MWFRFIVHQCGFNEVRTVFLEKLDKGNILIDIPDIDIEEDEEAFREYISGIAIFGFGVIYLVFCIILVRVLVLTVLVQQEQLCDCSVHVFVMWILVRM
jgi:hypothetical protein